jgi:hypothetical protein
MCGPVASQSHIFHFIVMRIATRAPFLLLLTPPCAQKRVIRTLTRRFASNAIKMEVKPGVTRIGETRVPNARTQLLPARSDLRPLAPARAQAGSVPG